MKLCKTCRDPVPADVYSKYCSWACALSGNILTPDGYWPLPGVCWPVKGQQQNGNGRVFHNKTSRFAHYVAYEVHTGKPAGWGKGIRLELTCGSRNCANPRHIRPSTDL